MLNFISSVISAFLGAGLASAIVTYYLEEKRRKNIKREEATEAVSDLLSEWVRSTYTGDCSNESLWKLQSMYWKTILRLDKKILDILIPRLANKANAQPTNEVIIKLRQALLDLKSPDLKAKDLNNWLPKK